MLSGSHLVQLAPSLLTETNSSTTPLKQKSTYLLSTIYMHIPIHDNQIVHHNPCYLCVFVVTDVKIAVYLESSGKINFNLVSDCFSK